MSNLSPRPQPPKYQLFQRVKILKDNKVKVGIGTITGMEYISPVVAISQRSEYGWFYIVREESGVDKPVDELVGAYFEPWYEHEDDLIALSQEALSAK